MTMINDRDRDQDQDQDQDQTKTKTKTKTMIEAMTEAMTKSEDKGFLKMAALGRGIDQCSMRHLKHRFTRQCQSVQFVPAPPGCRKVARSRLPYLRIDQMIVTAQISQDRTVHCPLSTVHLSFYAPS